MTKRHTIIILMADDDDDDILLTQKALQKGQFLNTLYCVKDGEELVDYLLHRGQYTDTEQYPRPGIILLDLNMPRKDGREALRYIKSHNDLRVIPTIVFTTSKAEEDIHYSYQSGANSFITKPTTFEILIEVMQTLEKYWLEIVKLPASKNPNTHGGCRDENSAH